MKSTLLVAVVGILALALLCPVAARACPDIIVCNKLVTNYENMTSKLVETGRFSWPTCYKFGHGCRPRHCDNARDLSDLHWFEECNRRFPNQCAKQNTSDPGCYATFSLF